MNNLQLDPVEALRKYPWFTIARIMACPDDELVNLKKMFTPAGPVFPTDIEHESVGVGLDATESIGNKESKTLDIIDKFLSFREYRIVPKEEICEEADSDNISSQIDGEVCSPELVQILRAQGQNQLADEMEKNLGLQHRH